MNGILNLVLLGLNALVLKRETLIKRIGNKPAAGGHALGKHPLFHPSPKHLLGTTTPRFNKSLSERCGVHMLPAPQKGPVKAEGYLC